MSHYRNAVTLEMRFGVVHYFPTLMLYDVASRNQDEDLFFRRIVDSLVYKDRKCGLERVRMKGRRKSVELSIGLENIPERIKREFSKVAKEKHSKLNITLYEWGLNNENYYHVLVGCKYE